MKNTSIEGQIEAIKTTLFTLWSLLRGRDGAYIIGTFRADAGKATLFICTGEKEDLEKMKGSLEQVLEALEDVI